MLNYETTNGNVLKKSLFLFKFSLKILAKVIPRKLHINEVKT